MAQDPTKRPELGVLVVKAWDGYGVQKEKFERYIGDERLEEELELFYGEVEEEGTGVRTLGTSAPRLAYLGGSWGEFSLFFLFA